MAARPTSFWYPTQSSANSHTDLRLSRPKLFESKRNEKKRKEEEEEKKIKKNDLNRTGLGDITNSVLRHIFGRLIFDTVDGY